MTWAITYASVPKVSCRDTRDCHFASMFHLSPIVTPAYLYKHADSYPRYLPRLGCCFNGAVSGFLAATQPKHHGCQWPQNHLQSVLKFLLHILVVSVVTIEVELNPNGMPWLR